MCFTPSGGPDAAVWQLRAVHGRDGGRTHGDVDMLLKASMAVGSSTAVGEVLLHVYDLGTADTVKKLNGAAPARWRPRRHRHRGGGARPRVVLWRDA